MAAPTFQQDLFSFGGSSPRPPQTMRSVELFAGAGGLGLGLGDAGFKHEIVKSRAIVTP